MAYSAATLITNAWYLSGIVARGLQTVSGGQMSDGLFLLNAVLGIKQAHTRLIPYYNTFSLTAVVGQELYFIPNLLEAETFTFFIDTVRFQTVKIPRKRYFGSSRPNNVSSLPFSWHLERTLGGSNLYLYFFPSQTFPLDIVGKFGLAQITNLDEDLSTVYDPFYLEYLRYALAEYMCSDYGIVFQPQSYKKLQEYENILQDISPLDLTMQKFSSLQGDVSLNWGYANLSGGWTIG